MDTPLTTVQVLEAAREKIKGGWTQGAFARDAKGTPLYPGEFLRGECFCAAGAVRACAFYYDTQRDALYALNSALVLIGGVSASAAVMSEYGAGTDAGDVYMFNDTPRRTQAEVIELFDVAIELARGLESEAA